MEKFISLLLDGVINFVKLFNLQVGCVKSRIKNAYSCLKSLEF
jgi:hypothetical protein